MNERNVGIDPNANLHTASNVGFAADGGTSALSWGAVIAGGVAAAALSLILLILGMGLGLSSVSPWTNQGVTATTLGVSTILWLTFTQLAASGMGGYLAGRLRSAWLDVHTDEVYFRDTAHGFLAWAVASLATAALLSSAIGSIVNGGAQASGAVAGGAGTLATTAAAGGAARSGPGTTGSGGDSGPTGYFMDSLFRKNATATGTANATPTADVSADSTGATPQSGNAPIGEVSRIFMNSIHSGPLSAEDTRYVGQLVAQRTGLSQQDAEKRVTETYSRLQTKLTDAETAAKNAADKARKASAYTALWLFISLLIGAFFSSLAATYGGRRRDL
jgi:hypothetical protein